MTVFCFFARLFLFLFQCLWRAANYDCVICVPFFACRSYHGGFALANGPLSYISILFMYFFLFFFSV